MAETITKKAYEFDCVSIGFIGKPALGDAIIVKKVFDTLILLEPNCKIDILCMDEKTVIYAKAFYYGENLNGLYMVSLNDEEFKKYDLTLFFDESNIFMLNINSDKIKRLSPALFESIVKLNNYNLKYINPKDTAGRILFKMARARILGINRYTSMACEGALPIHDNKVEIRLLPEWQGEFEKLGLKKYITIGSNGGNFNRHLVKEWPARYFVEFISLLKFEMPEIEIIQTGGNGVIPIENADRQLLGTDLELTKYILKNSLLHVDCEGGPVHLASQLGTKCIALFGAVDVKYLGFKQNFNIVSEICSPCYFAWDSGKQCLRGAKEPPCMLSITPQKVFDVAYRYLKSLGVTN